MFPRSPYHKTILCVDYLLVNHSVAPLNDFLTPADVEASISGAVGELREKTLVVVRIFFLMAHRENPVHYLVQVDQIKQRLLPLLKYNAHGLKHDKGHGQIFLAGWS